MPCTSGVCKVEVTVVDCDGGRVPATPDPIPVDRPSNIQWTISSSTPGYKFASNGIETTGSDFSDHHVTGNGQMYIVHDSHQTRGFFKYTVNMVRISDNRACRPSDPYIQNN